MNEKKGSLGGCHEMPSYCVWITLSASTIFLISCFTSWSFICQISLNLIWSLFSKRLNFS